MLAYGRLSRPSVTQCSLQLGARFQGRKEMRRREGAGFIEVHAKRRAMRSTEQKATGATTGNKQSLEVTEEIKDYNHIFTLNHIYTLEPSDQQRASTQTKSPLSVSLIHLRQGNES